MKFWAQLKKFSHGFFTNIFLDPKSDPWRELFLKKWFLRKKFGKYVLDTYRKIKKKMQRNFIFRRGAFYFFVWMKELFLIPKHFVSFPWPTFCWRNNRPADETIDQLTKQSTSWKEQQGFGHENALFGLLESKNIFFLWVEESKKYFFCLGWGT